METKALKKHILIWREKKSTPPRPWWHLQREGTLARKYSKNAHHSAVETISTARNSVIACLWATKRWVFANSDAVFTEFGHTECFLDCDRSVHICVCHKHSWLRATSICISLFVLCDKHDIRKYLTGIHYAFGFVQSWT